MPFYLAPYIGMGTFLDSFRPRGSIQPGWSAIDLRPDGSVITGRCLLHLPVHDPDPQLVRLADAPDENVTLPRRRAWGTALGVTLTQTRFDRIVEELLTLHARTDGTRWKPLRAMVDGRMRIYLGGLLSEWLPGSVGAAISDNFNRANADALGTSSEGWSWTEMQSDTDIVTNRAESTTIDADVSARADSNLATDNHYAEARVDMPNLAQGGAVGCLIRKDATTTLSFYFAIAYFTLDVLRFFKSVAGAQTQLGADVSFALTQGTPVLLRFQANGSTLELFIDTVSQGTRTDTEVPSDNLRTGLWGFRLGPGAPVCQWDDFAAADLAAGGATWPGWAQSRGGWW